MIEKAPKSENEMSYEDAILYCRFCTYKGYTDWRLPTSAEYFITPEIAVGCWFYCNNINNYKAIDKAWTVPVRDI